MKNKKRRTIKKIISPQLASEGGGLSWMSSISPSEYINYDPFISFDHFYKNESISTGYYHTSRKFSGMINFTYLLSGQIKFRINENKIGKIKQGEMIVLNSGDGARYEQVFEPVNNHIEGFQIGINLSSSQKQAPFSLNVVDQLDTRMEFSDKGIYVRNLFKTTPDDDHTLDISDLALPPNTTYSYPIADYETVFAYLYQGRGYFGAYEDSKNIFLHRSRLILFNQGDYIQICTEETPLRLLIVSGKKIGEPISRYGSIIKNTQIELNEYLKQIRI